MTRFVVKNEHQNDMRYIEIGPRVHKLGGSMWPKSDKTTIWTPIFMSYVVRYEFESGHQKFICLKEIGVQAQTMLSVFDLIVKTWVGIWPLDEHWVRYPYEFQTSWCKWL